MSHITSTPTAQHRIAIQVKQRKTAGPASVVLATLALVACGGGGGGGNPATPPIAVEPPPPPSAVTLPASEPGALLSYVQKKLNLQIDQGLAGNGEGAFAFTGAVLTAVAAPAGVTLSAGAATASPSYASTTLQEGGVDESDILKTDSNRLFSMTVAKPGDQRLSKLQVHTRLADGSLQAASSLALPNTDVFEGLHLAGNGEQLALVGRSQGTFVPGIINPLASSTTSTVTTTATTSATTSASTTALTLLPAPNVVKLETVINFVSAKAGQPLSTTTTLRIDGQLIDSRTIDNTLYVVTSWLPRFDTVFPLAVAGAAAATVTERKDAVNRITNPQILPTVSIQAASASAATVQPLMADTDCQLQAANASTAVQLTTVTAINLASPELARSSRCFLGGVNGLYMSAKNLYLATSRTDVVTKGGSLIYGGEPTTDIHKFGVNGMAISYRGSGSVNGHLGWDASKTSYRMSEHNNDLRIVTYTGSFGWFGTLEAPSSVAAKSPAILSVLREDASASNQLKTIATLPNAKRPAPIGLSGEQVYAVRFLGNRAYVVTFRRTDPLYVVDLADPLDPKVTGELKTNGYSDYLLPVGPDSAGLLLGVGKDANSDGRVQGVKVSLFDVSDAAAPKELASRVVGKAGSLSGLDFDRHGINLFNVGNTTRIAIPMRVNQTLGTSGGFYVPTYQSLVRFEVDAVNKTLTDKPTLNGQTFTSEFAGYQASSLEFERSVQIGANIYYLGSQGSFTAAGW
jgi:Beta propeller domain